ncbi:MAG TPA: DinB family protein [Gemmatimonadaceae bacterium]|nr:DinB family protein [Gemmatimonadaceae bacterium]
MPRITLVLLFACALPLSGQSTTPAAAAPRSNAEFARRAWREVHGHLVQAATSAPESLFAFRPTPEVRSFGEMLDHVAASERGYCQMALGERPTAGGAGTGARTRAEILAALLGAAEICERAHGQHDVDLDRPAFGGGRASRLHVLLENAMHDTEHYGNVVTYLRLRGMVPPSSQPAPR